MIIITKPLASSTLPLFGYADNIIEFQSDSLIKPLNATLLIGGETVIIYPNPQGKFYFNYKVYITAIFGKAVNKSGRFYYTNNDIIIKFINNTTESKNVTALFYNYYLPRLISTEISILSPKKIKIYFHSDLYFLNNIFIRNGNAPFYLIRNNVNILTTLPANGLIPPVEDLPDYINVSGTYGISLNSVAPFTIIDSIEVVYEPPTNCEKLSIKFINNYGTFSFWDFDYFQINRQTKDLGTVTSDTNVLRQIGKESKDLITVEIDKNYIELFEQLLESDYIVDNNTGFEIELTASSKEIKDFKNALKPFTLQFELPPRYTRKL